MPRAAPRPYVGGSMTIDEIKKQAACRAVDETVKSGYRIGLGTGSTAAHAVYRVAEHIRSGRLKDVFAVATSVATKELCREVGVPVFSLNDSRIQGQLDCAIDGADEVSPGNQLIKGGGAAHLLEKIVEYNAASFYVIVDESKLVSVLNKSCPVPLEIIPEARETLIRRLEGAGFSLRLRVQSSRPVITDSGNQILDLFAPEGEGMERGGPFDPAAMEAWLNTLPGLVESGLFTCPVTRVYIGMEEGVTVREG